MIRRHLTTFLFGLLGLAVFLTPVELVAQAPIAKFTASGLRPNEVVGYSVATDGNLVLIGTGAGSAFLYDPFSQQQLAKFTVPIDPRFSTSVALEGTTAVVGTRAGAYVYDFSDLSNITYLELQPNDGPKEQFGVSVDISGNAVIVGANGDDFAGPFTGSAYLFNRSTGTQFAKLAANDAKASDNFGISVAIDGNNAAVGSVRSDNSSGDPFGAVYLFNAQAGFVGNRQLDKYSVSSDDPNPLPSFGYNVDIWGDSMLALEAVGHSYVWQIEQQPNVQLGPAVFRSAGDALSLFDELAGVGFPGSNAVKLYDLAGLPAGGIAQPEPTAVGFGFSVAICGDLVVVGSPRSADGGAAYVYLLKDVLVPEPSSACLVVTLIALVGRSRSSRCLTRARAS
jgi:hypothetical protein